MSEPLYLLTIGIVPVTVLLVFGMKYLAAGRQARSRILVEDAYRQLAERAVAAQAETTASLAAIRTELADVKTGLAAVHQILKTVE